MLRAINNIRKMTTSAGTYTGEIMREKSSFKMHVSRLPWTISDRELTTYFAQFGPIVDARVVFDRVTGLSQGYGFVTFQYWHSHAEVLKKKNVILEGRLLTIREANQI